MKLKRSGKQGFRRIDPSEWDRGALLRLLRRIEGRKILVIGDVGVDRYTIGTVERISPEAPVPIVAVEQEKLKLGLAANVADNVKTLGGVPYLVGVVGKDRCAQDLRALLRESGIGPQHLVTDASRRTVLKERVVSERQQLLRIDYENGHSVSGAPQRGIVAKVRQLLPRVDAVILEDYAKGLITEETSRAIFSAAKSAGKIVSVDTNQKTPLRFYAGATVLKPNTKQAQELSGIVIRDEASLARAGRKILGETGARHVVITLGKDGMAIFSAGTESISVIPTYAREVYDVSGAGDTVISVLTLALTAGARIEDASILGNLAAGVEVGKRGTATVSPAEIRAAIEFFSSRAG